MTYSLRRESDGAGDSGPMSCAIIHAEGKVLYEQGARPRVGVELQVGAIGSRTYAAQDYWHVTQIQEILEDTPDMVRFRTLNSVYVWRQF
jgi:hypothetical protein